MKENDYIKLKVDAREVTSMLYGLIDSQNLVMDN